MSEIADFEDKDEEGKDDDQKQEAAYFFWEVVRLVIVSLVIIVPIRYFLVQPFFVKGTSMEENFDNGDYLLIDELTYRFREPRRGEVMVFRYPKDPRQFFIKRIIGLPGEELQIRHNEVIIFNAENSDGFILDESAYLPKQIETTGNFRINLDQNEYFVMGDNREHSSDSRIWGAVNKNLINGRAFFRAWPFTEFGLVRGAEYWSSPFLKNPL